MKCRKAYAIIPVGENDRSAHVAQQKAPEVATPGLFYSVRCCDVDSSDNFLFFEEKIVVLYW